MFDIHSKKNLLKDISKVGKPSGFPVYTVPINWKTTTVLSINNSKDSLTDTELLQTKLYSECEWNFMIIIKLKAFPQEYQTFKYSILKA